MNEYVLKQDAIDTIMGQPPDAHYPSWYAAQIEELPPADVVQVVRCKDCKYRESDDFCVGRGFPYQLVAGDEFCSRAKTKEHIND